MATQTASANASGALEPLFAPRELDDLSGHYHRQFIGGSGMALPVVLWLIAGIRTVEGLPQWGVPRSVSAYYFTGAVAAFVGILVALAVYLFTYDGYDNSDRGRDRRAAVIAGTAALLVAFFPTEAPEGFAPPWWSAATGTIHNIAAAVLFSAFSYFSLVLFPKSSVGAGGTLPRDKAARNWVYRACGIGMLGCMAWALIAARKGAPIFLPEALALEFFAISWLVKGRALRTAIAAGRRTLRYGRHPKQLIGDAWRALRR